MKKLWPLLLLGLSACPMYENNVKTEPSSQPKTYSRYVSQCNDYPYPDSIYVDTCFEFDCRVKKFLVWDHTCENAPQANALTESNREYYGKLEDYR